MIDREISGTIIALPKSEALIAHAAAAIHAVSIGEQKLVSIRAAALAGFDMLIQDKRIDAVVVMQIYERYDFTSKEKFHVSFSPEEMKVLHECRRRLEALRQAKLDRVQTITMALLRTGRPEFGHPASIDPRNLPMHESRLLE